MIARKLEVACVLALLVITALVYAPTLTYTFVADDSSQILANTHIHSWRYLPVYFTSHVWSQIALAPGDHAAPYYRPLFLLWLLLNYSVFGYAVAAWHASAVLLHTAVTFLVYLLTRRLVRHWPLALTAALFFGLHPVHIEAVAWVSGTTESVMAAPFLAAVICYIETSRAERRTLWVTAAAAFYFAALLAKETAIVLPAILIAYDLLLREPRESRGIAAALRRMALFVLVAAVYWAMRANALRGIHVNDVPAAAFLNTLPAVIWFYTAHLLAPVGLSFFYNSLTSNRFGSPPS
jgi:protein O-mannosyl-transferase